MRELALFAGMGGGILGGKLLGWETVCAVELNDYCRRILMQRQDDGILEPFPIWDDITTFDGKPWAGCVDIVSGGFPCQDISAAGKGAGIDGERSGLWREMARVIGEVRPRYVLVENSPVLTVRGLGTVLGDLAALRYDAEWCVLGAADLGAPHKRERAWIFANHYSEKLSLFDRCSTERGSQITSPWAVDFDDVVFGDRVGRKRVPKPGIRRVADGSPNRMDRLKALGNGQVPRVAAAAFAALIQRMETS